MLPEFPGHQFPKEALMRSRAPSDPARPKGPLALTRGFLGACDVGMEQLLRRLSDTS